jgi:hypothetical protein
MGIPEMHYHIIHPDIHATNYPIGRQVVNDSGATRSFDTIFEVKTYTFCPTRYNHNYRNTTKRLTQTQQTDVHERYSMTIHKHKFRNLDVTFASASARCGRW